MTSSSWQFSHIPNKPEDVRHQIETAAMTH